MPRLYFEIIILRFQLFFSPLTFSSTNTHDSQNAKEFVGYQGWTDAAIAIHNSGMIPSGLDNSEITTLRNYSI